jgi:hypothetical protein
MLSINSSSKLRSEHKEHGWALRAIGQDLAAVVPTDLQIEFTGQVYVVRGHGKASAPRPAKKPGAVGRLVSKLKRTEGNDGNDEGKAVPFERHYPLAKIHSLAEQGKSRRRNSPLSPDINILGERLRAVGKLIEAKSGQFIKLTMDDYRVTCTYRDVRGEVHEEEHTTPALYRSQKEAQPRRLAGKERCPWDKARK